MGSVARTNPPGVAWTEIRDAAADAVSGRQPTRPRYVGPVRAHRAPGLDTTGRRATREVDSSPRYALNLRGWLKRSGCWEEEL